MSSKANCTIGLVQRLQQNTVHSLVLHDHAPHRHFVTYTLLYKQYANILYNFSQRLLSRFQFTFSE